MQLTPAATVLILKNGGPPPPEVLLVQRNPKMPVMGDIWVFPGGRIASRDAVRGITLGAAQRCAVRETCEEAGLRLPAADLVPMARWVTPAGFSPRFDTWFFAARVAPNERVHVDGREIVDHRWIAAEEALTAQAAGEIQLSPPAFVFLSYLARVDGVDLFLDLWRRGPLRHIEPRFVPLSDGGCSLFREDAGYSTGDLQQAGARHRLWMRRTGWRYEQDAVVQQCLTR